MKPTSGATPLSVLDAVAVDTETTSLDTSVARIIEIGCVSLHGEQEFATLVNPRAPIPPSASAVHGITAGDGRRCTRLCRCLCGLRRLRTPSRPDRLFDRLRSRDPRARIRPRRHVLEEAALTMRAPVVRSRQSVPSRLFARHDRDLARRGHRGPPSRTGRREGRGGGLLCPSCRGSPIAASARSPRPSAPACR